jgi:NAD(P)-dependent dehydrogenase (short-subunit alcohol dehydrogenase family)
MGTLAGRVALVTGAASGIGAATAARLAKEGAKVVVVDLDGPGTERVAAAVGGVACRADVTDPSDVTHMIACACS